MPLEPGSRIGAYEVVSPLGAGGMGEVYRAADPKLGRDVAIKLLPEAFAEDPERLARFEREARVLASLSHPGIAHLYGYDAATLPDGHTAHFLVMELAEGEDLARRLERGPVPGEEALSIAGKIAEALEEAHAQGIVHRDLKPANVKVTPDGKVKVLDFGLAKAWSGEGASVVSGSGGALSHSPTLALTGTQAGVILGTAAYMSPEQARGRPADARADVWAFGVVLFEMLTGKRLFEGDTVSDILASVLKTEPDWNAVPPETSSGVRRLLRRCLTKDPDNRLHHIADARLEIRDAQAGNSPDEAIISAASRRAPRTRLLPWTVAALGILLAALSLWLGRPFSKPESRPLLSLAVPFPHGTRLFEGGQKGTLAISPTGAHLAVVLTQDGVPKIFLRALDRPGVVPLDGTENATMPFFSPDGRWLGFIADGKLKKVPVDGGTPLAICDAPGENRGASWSAGDVIVLSSSNNSPLTMVPASGGTPRPLTTLDEKAKERTHRWPQVMPGGDVVLFTVGYIGSSESYEQSPIDAVRISTGERKRILEGASFARYAENGHLLFARGGFLFAVPFDPDALETRGKPVPVMEGVMGSRNSGVAYMDVSAGGVLAFIPGKQTAVRRVLMWAYPDGTRESVATPADAYSNPYLSADGLRIVFTLLGDQSQDVWTYDLKRETTTRLTFKGNNILPIWSPDGRWVAFSSDRVGRLAVYRKPSDGTGEAEKLLGAADNEYRATSWSPDGRFLAVEVGPSRGAASDIWILSLEDGKRSEFLSTEHDESKPTFSPDGRWIAYQSDETGRDEIYVRPFPGPGGKWQLSAHGGEEPYWSRDGSRVFFLNDAKVWAVDVESQGESFRSGRPRVIVENLRQVFSERNYAVDPNGERFLFCEGAEGESDPDRVVVVVNWFDELRRRR